MTPAPSKMPWQNLGGGGDPWTRLCVTTRKVECVGSSFMSFWLAAEAASCQNLAHNTSGEKEKVEEVEEENEEAPLKYHEDPDYFYLQCLNPKDWKNQDHYSVLGLKTLRFLATQDDIKKAYRMKMLMHHPDKRKDVAIRFEDDYFSCITRAWEVLGNPKTRRSYDSVDKAFDDYIPANSSYNKDNFYRVFSKVFVQNARWSKVQPVPQLGSEMSRRQEVDAFYSFWYNFQSWREFTYHEDEDDEKSSYNEERKLRKNEVTRIRKLVDVAYSLDPRISVFKQEEKEKKLAAKQNRKQQAHAKQVELRKRLEVEETESRQLKEIEEAEAKEIQDLLKVERNARKRAMKASRAKLCTLVKANEYYVASPEEQVPHMMGLEAICQAFYADKLAELVASLGRWGRDAFLDAMLEATHIASKSTPTVNSRKVALDFSSWTEYQLKLLAKAVELYPSGRKHRWELVADFVNQYVTDNVKTSKDVEVKSKELRRTAPSEKTHMASSNDNAYEILGAHKKDDQNAESNISESHEAMIDQANEIPWMETELFSLELAKQTYPAYTPGRWEKIAAFVGSRTKDECMREVKQKAKRDRELATQTASELGVSGAVSDQSKE